MVMDIVTALCNGEVCFHCADGGVLVREMSYIQRGFVTGTQVI